MCAPFISNRLSRWDALGTIACSLVYSTEEQIENDALQWRLSIIVVG